MADAESKPHFRHISDIEVWLTPDRSYLVYIILALFPLTGFFALDHVYLRSFNTAFQKFFYNFFGLGIWYWWDILQVLTDGAKVQQAGLTSPFDWTQGIGRGVFNFSDRTAKFVPEKSYIIWAFLALFGGFFALDKFYLGDYLHAFSKCISIFFVFGIFWVAWDAFHAFFMTKEVISGKISLPIPLTWIGFNETDGSIFLPSEPKKQGVSLIAQMISGLSPKKAVDIATIAGFGKLKDTLTSLTDRAKQVEAKIPTPAVPSVGNIATAASNTAAASLAKAATTASGATA